MRQRRFFPRAVRREFWEQVRQGLTVAEAAGAVGATRFSGMDWYRDRGGVMPDSSPPATTRPTVDV